MELESEDNMEVDPLCMPESEDIAELEADASMEPGCDDKGAT